MADLDYSELIPEDITTEEIENTIFDRIQDQFPGWEPSEAQLEVWIVKSLALAVSDLMQITTDVAAEIFAYFGETIMNLPRTEAITATADTTWTTIDNSSYLIPAGTLVSIANGLDTVTFETISEVTSTGGTASVPVRAVDAGSAANDLNGSVALIDSLAFVNTITLDAPTAGGINQESMDEYLPRLVELLQLMSPRPILPKHFEVLARQYGAYRAVAVEGLDPDANTTGNELTMTVAVMDEDGDVLPAGTSSAFATKAFIKAQLEAQLMANSVLFIIDPTYTNIDVTSTIVSQSGYDHAAVVDAVEAALADYFKPINWGRILGTGQQTTTWENTTTVRYLEIAEVINRVPGVKYISALTFKKTGGSLGTSDVTISGHVPLTRPGTFAIS